MSRPLVVDPIQDPLVAARASRTVRWYVPPADSATRAPEWRPIERAGEAGESAQAPAMPEEPPPETGLSLDEIDLATVNAGVLDFNGLGGFTGGGTGSVRYVLNGPDAIVRVDADGDGGGDMKIVLTGVGFLDAGDFIL